MPCITTPVDATPTNNLISTLVKDHNIPILTSRNLYTHYQLATNSLSNWKNSIDLASQDPLIKVSLALARLDEDLLNRLRRLKPNLHAFTWNNLNWRLESYITPVNLQSLFINEDEPSLTQFRLMLTTNFSRYYDGTEPPTDYIDMLICLHNTICSEHLDRFNEIPTLHDLIQRTMIRKIRNPWREILSKELRNSKNNLDDMGVELN